MHGHYWLSGWVGRAAKEYLGAPLVSSFHTLGKVKNYSLARGESPEPVERLVAEEATIRASDVILAPTPQEAGQLVGLYGADRIGSRSSRPASTTRSSCRATARGAGAAAPVGLGSRCSSGGCSRTKGPDVAIRTLAEVVARGGDDAGTSSSRSSAGRAASAGAEVARLMGSPARSASPTA